MDFFKEIEGLLQTNLKTYDNDPSRFVADYNHEQELRKEYNGRQLLELLQNADDAGAKRVHIDWDKESCILAISNEGEGFSIGGVKSLMLANYSPKVTSTYIGNKGLGFRSILNWASEIEVVTRGCSLKFSERIAEKAMKEKLAISEGELNKIRDERNLSQTAIPFPVLAVPKVCQVKKETPWATTVRISCNPQSIWSIEKQLKEITDEILLFLNHIRRISISTANSCIDLRASSDQKEEYAQVSVWGNTWKVFAVEGELPSHLQDKDRRGMERYSLKVGFEEDLSDKFYRLFNFFPTQVRIKLPCLLHGTFDLDSSRNHLNQSKKNEFVLKQLVQLLKKAATFLTQEKVDWRPYSLLTPVDTSTDSELISEFYQQLEENRNRLKIFPTIGESYVVLNQVKHYDNEINTFLKDHFVNNFPELILPFDNLRIRPFNTAKPYNKSQLEKRLTSISQNLESLDVRAHLIYWSREIIRYHQGESFALPLSVNDQLDVIISETAAFTPFTATISRFPIPAFVPITFLNRELYSYLLELFSDRIGDKDDQKARELQREIRNVVNLQPYDRSTVVERIVTETRRHLKSSASLDSKAVLKEMVRSLYVNYSEGQRRSDHIGLKVPLLDRHGEIKEANELYLGPSYSSGKLTMEIYGELISDEEYLEDFNFWEINPDEVDIDDFFVWLGVNRHCKMEVVELAKVNDVGAYFRCAFVNGTIKPEEFATHRVQPKTSVHRLSDPERLNQLPLTNLLLLLLCESRITSKVNENQEDVWWYYNKYRSFKATPSFISFQLNTFIDFSTLIIADGYSDLITLLNEGARIDYQLLNKHGFDKLTVDAMLLKLGAKASVDHLEPEIIYELLNRIYYEFQGSSALKGITSWYKVLLDALDHQNSTHPIPEDLHLLASVNDTNSFLPAKDVFYSDNQALPKQVLNSIPILALQKRSGEKKAKNYFGVQTMADFQLQITDVKYACEALNTELDKQFERLKPFLLAYRLFGPTLRRRTVSPNFKTEQANKLKACRVKLVRSCKFSYKEHSVLDLDEDDFIRAGGEYYYRASVSNSLGDLRNSPQFCDAFAEMLCDLFDVNEIKNDFRFIFKNDIADTKHLAFQDIGEDKLNECFEMLGIPLNQLEFWKLVFQKAGKDISDLLSLANESELQALLADKYDLKLSDGLAEVDYDKFSNEASFKLLKSICDRFDLPLESFLKEGLYDYHKEKVRQKLADFEKKADNLIWLKLQAEPDQQSEYIALMRQFNDLAQSKSKSLYALRYEFDLDYTELIINWCKESLNLDLQNDSQQSVEIKNHYQDLLNSYDVEENDLKDISVKSLLYFEKNDKLIAGYLDQTFPKKSSKDEEQKPPEVEAGNLISASLAKGAGPKSGGSNGRARNNYVHSKSEEKLKQLKGKLAEDKVVATLQKEFGDDNVIPLSGNVGKAHGSDSHHFDLKYKDHLGNWKFAEVKSISGNSLIITSPELEEGIKRSRDYVLILVKGEDIYLIEDIFQFQEDESLQNNSKFHLKPKDYYMYFELEQLKIKA